MKDTNTLTKTTLQIKDKISDKLNPKFYSLKQELINAVSAMCEPTLSVLLYGNTELSYEQNKEIFLSVRKYIVKSKRFRIQ